MKAASLERIQQLVLLLSDGHFHSGEQLANSLKVSRTAIWKLISKLQTWQIEVYAIRGKGYKIPGGLTLINKQYLIKEIASKARLFERVEVLPTLDSTADYVARKWADSPGKGLICIAEHQTGGRGRKGRKWISPFAANLYFSLGLNMPLGLSALGGLSLAIGIGLTQLLNQHSAAQVSLKWPNDILVDGHKLAGILVEASGDSNDNSFLNIGIGINWNMPASIDGIEQKWINLKSILKSPLDRNELLLLMLLKLDEVLLNYIEYGFEHFRDEWPEHSAYYGKPIVLHTPGGKIHGTESGIDPSGAIRIKTYGGEKAYFSGEVSLRAKSKTS